MSAFDDLTRMLAEGRANDPNLNNSSSESVFGYDPVMPGQAESLSANGLFDQYFDKIEQQIRQNNIWSAEQAQKQMDFQERMSNTAHQREIADLKAAGLNPVLSARLGGASTPSGAMADIDQSGTNAMASLMNKVLDIANDNAKAQMYMAARSGSGSTSASSEMQQYSSDITTVAQLFGVNSNTAKAIGKLPEIVDRKLEESGLPDDSKLRQYVRGEKSILGLISDSKVGQAVKTAIDESTKNTWKDVFDPNKPAATSTGQKVKDALIKAKDAVVDFGKWLIGKK